MPAKFKLPKFPFPGKKNAGPEPVDDPAEEAAVSSDLDYLEPTSFQKKLPLIAAFAGWAITIGIIGGVAGYVMVSEKAILQAMVDARPKAEVDEIRIVREKPAPPEDGSESLEGADRTDRANAGDDGPAQDQPGEDAYAGLLQPHPNPDLIENSPVGPLPVIAADGRESWRVYSRPSNPIETRPRIAIVISDLGINTAATEQALKLPGAVTLAFAPYSRKLEEWIGKARALGHEALLTLPMEPASFPKSDPGPFALMSTLDSEQNRKRLEWVLSRATGYVGVIGYQGSGFTANNRAVRPLMGNLKSRGLLFIDAKQSAASTASATARAAGVPNARADILLDSRLSRANVLKQLKLVESLARANGTAIAVGHPYPVTLERIRIWVQGLLENGYVLVPVSGIVANRTEG